MWSGLPDGNSALMLVAARLRNIAGTQHGSFEMVEIDRSLTVNLLFAEKKTQ
jgi:hypothetical protein